MENMLGNISTLDFFTATSYFLVTMIVFFTLKKTRQRWLNRAFLIAFIFYGAVVVLSPKNFETKLFVSLLTISVVTIQFIVSRKRRALNN